MAFPTLAGSPIGAELSGPASWTAGVTGTLEAYFGECGGFIVETSQPEALESIAMSQVDLIRIGQTRAGTMLHLEDAQFDLRDLHRIWRAPLAQVYP